MFRKICLAAMLILCSQTARAEASCEIPANFNEMRNAIAVGVNASRQQNGLAALKYNQTLSQAAMGHACDMAQNAFFGHVGSNGSNSQARVRASGYRDCTVAENLAWGYPRPTQIINGWMNSAKHRSNMTHPRVSEMGIGITSGSKGPIWVLILARRC